MGFPPIRPVMYVALIVALVAGSCSWSTPELDPDLPEAARTSAIYSADGTLITELHGEENRKPITYDEIPQVLIDAVVAIEDERFWLHNGVDVRGVIRAASENATSGGIAQGGSTITQQYVKNALVGDDQTVNRKVREAALALQLEQDYAKEVILELYLNTIYFGRGVYGVESASLEYFAVSAADLSVDQAALLAGLIRSPVSTDPFRAPDLALGRRDLVLERMAELGYLTTGEAVEAAGRPLELAPEFDVAESYPAAHFVEEVKAFILDDPAFGETWEQRRDLLFTGGLRITTTVDLELQALAEQAVAAVLPDTDEGPEASVVSVEPGTGYVRAMVGGQDFFADTETAKYNLATGKGRQAGSAFKPLVLAAALQNRIVPVTPCLRRPLAHRDPPAQQPRVERLELWWRRRRAGHNGRGHRSFLQHAVCPAGDGCGPRPSRSHGHRARYHHPPRGGAFPGVGLERRHPPRHGEQLRHLCQPRGPRRPRLCHPRHPPRRHRPLGAHPRADEGSRRRDRRPDLLGAHRGGSAGDGHPRPPRGPERGGQDRYRPGLEGRLVRGVHPRAGHLGVGGVPRGTDPDDPAAHPHSGHRRIVAGRDLGHLYGAGSCSQL